MSNLPISSDKDIRQFLQQVKDHPLQNSGQGRLIFAMDATMSRQPSWDRACHLQGEMFQATRELGGLAIQLVWFRGYGEFYSSDWFDQSAPLLQVMSSVTCQGGITQIEKILRHGLRETTIKTVNAIVFVGDCVEENADKLCHLAGQLGVLGVPLFLFHEGDEVSAGAVFKELARLSRGAYCPFDSRSAHQLKELLQAVAVYASGGGSALARLARERGGMMRQLSRQLQG